MKFLDPKDQAKLSVAFKDLFIVLRNSTHELTANESQKANLLAAPGSEKWPNGRNGMLKFFVSTQFKDFKHLTTYLTTENPHKGARTRDALNELIKENYVVSPQLLKKGDSRQETESKLNQLAIKLTTSTTASTSPP